MKKISVLLCILSLIGFSTISAQTAYFNVNEGVLIYDDEWFSSTQTDFKTQFDGTYSSPHPVYVTVNVGSRSETKVAWTTSNAAVLRAAYGANHSHSYRIDTSTTQTRAIALEE